MDFIICGTFAGLFGIGMLCEYLDRKGERAHDEEKSLLKKELEHAKMEIAVLQQRAKASESHLVYVRDTEIEDLRSELEHKETIIANLKRAIERHGEEEEL